MVLSAAKWTERSLRKSALTAPTCFALSDAPKYCIEPVLQAEGVLSTMGVIQ